MKKLNRALLWKVVTGEVLTEAERADLVAGLSRTYRWSRKGSVEFVLRSDAQPSQVLSAVQSHLRKHPSVALAVADVYLKPRDVDVVATLCVGGSMDLLHWSAHWSAYHALLPDGVCVNGITIGVQAIGPNPAVATKPVYVVTASGYGNVNWFSRFRSSVFRSRTLTVTNQTLTLAKYYGVIGAAEQLSGLATTVERANTLLAAWHTDKNCMAQLLQQGWALQTTLHVLHDAFTAGLTQAEQLLDAIYKTTAAREVFNRVLVPVKDHKHQRDSIISGLLSSAKFVSHVQALAKQKTGFMGLFGESRVSTQAQAVLSNVSEHVETQVEYDTRVAAAAAAVAPVAMDRVSTLQSTVVEGAEPDTSVLSSAALAAARRRLELDGDVETSVLSSAALDAATVEAARRRLEQGSEAEVSVLPSTALEDAKAAMLASAAGPMSPMGARSGVRVVRGGNDWGDMSAILSSPKLTAAQRAYYAGQGLSPGTLEQSDADASAEWGRVSGAAGDEEEVLESSALAAARKLAAQQQARQFGTELGNRDPSAAGAQKRLTRSAGSVGTNDEAMFAHPDQENRQGAEGGKPVRVSKRLFDPVPPSSAGG